jgi:hypothetical protein
MLPNGAVPKPSGFINMSLEAIHQARAAGEPIAPIVIDYNMSLAERTCARVVTSAAHKGLLSTGNPSLRSRDRPRARGYPTAASPRWSETLVAALPREY